MSALLFYLFAIVAVASAIGMILGRNATYSVLLAVVNFAMVAMLFLMLDAPFLAAVQILVYAGAILVLFLFVVMLMGNDPGPVWEHIPIQRPLGLLFTIALIAALVPVVALENVTGQRTPAPVAAADNPTQLGQLLYSNYLLPFEVTSVILLIAIIGAIVLAKRGAYRTEREEALHLDEL
jgi:NADH-quinone oxidoreductase subunit J